MAGRSPQTQAKRARELALREKRERKEAKKAEAAARKAAGIPEPWAVEGVDVVNGDAGEAAADESPEHAA